MHLASSLLTSYQRYRGVTICFLHLLHWCHNDRRYRRRYRKDCFTGSECLGFHQQDRLENSRYQSHMPQGTLVLVSSSPVKSFLPESLSKRSSLTASAAPFKSIQKSSRSSGTWSKRRMHQMPARRCPRTSRCSIPGKVPAVMFGLVSRFAAVRTLRAGPTMVHRVCIAQIAPRQ